MQKIIGVDFGVPRRAGDQAKKIILMEAVKLSGKRYSIEPAGRNERLVRPSGGKSWRQRRRGWMLDELRESVCRDGDVGVAAFDFPFSVPLELLRDRSFAQAVGAAREFSTRAAWQAWVADKMPLEFNGDKASSVMTGWHQFGAWRDTKFWISRATDKATRASPPLKDKFQSVFNMTIAGASLLGSMVKCGYQEQLSSLQQGRAVFETYPREVAARLGFAGSYKQQPLECLECAIVSLEKRGVELDFDPAVKAFCQQYTTGEGDHDGVDAFLCLAAAICFDQGQAEICGEVVDEEGAIVVPRR